MLVSARPSAKTIRDTEKLAEELANGCPSIAEAGRRVGLTRDRTNHLWARIRAELGEQAV